MAAVHVYGDERGARWIETVHDHICAVVTQHLGRVNGTRPRA
jgi:hypothetical protein